MTPPAAHKWAFAPRFRRHAFGWRSQPAVQRVRQAVAEIQKVAKKDPAKAAAGAVLFLEKVSPALEQVDSSSGAIGTSVNHAIETCARIIAEAPVDDETRDRWLDRLWEAHQNDEIPYRASPPCAGSPPAMATRSRELTYSPRARAPWLPPGTVDGSTRSRGESVRWSPVRGQPPRTSLPRRLGHERSRDVQARTCEGRSTTYDRRSHQPHG